MNHRHKRQTYLDSLRGIAAIIVVIHHYLLVFYPYTVYGNQEYYIQHFVWENYFFYPPLGIINAGRLAVCLFFILSGYVLSYNHLGYSNKSINIIAAIIKRPIRLGGVVYFSIICGAFLWYLNYFTNDSIALVTSSHWFGRCWPNQFDFHRLLFVLKTAPFARGRVFDPPLWTIEIELYGSIMVFLYALIFGKFKYRILICALLIILFRNSIYQGFWIGLCIADLNKNYIPLKQLALSRISSICIVILIIYFSSYPNFVTKEFIKSTIYSYLPDNRFFGGGYPMLPALLIFILVLSSNKLKRLLTHSICLSVGKLSYSIYAIHFLVLGSFSSWLFLLIHNFVGYNFAFMIVFLLSSAVIITASYLSTKYADTPSILLANFIGKKVVAISSSLPYPPKTK